MLDSSLCPQTYSRWVALTSLISHSFASKAIPLPVRLAAIALLVLGFVLLVWIARHPKWKRKFSRKLRWNRRRTRFVITCVIICLLIISPIGVTLANQVLVAAVPMTSNATADAIVVLGRGPKLGVNRIEVAAALWRAKRAPKVFVSGRGDAFLMIQQLKQKGVSEKALDGEECSMTTEGNAKFTAHVLIPKGVKRILLVTDPSHMLRSLLTFKNQGFQVIPFASPLPPELGYREKASIVFREYGGLISYVLWGRFF